MDVELRSPANMRVLVPVLDAHGSIVRHEWRDVDGWEIVFTPGVELKNGETLVLPCILMEGP